MRRFPKKIRGFFEECGRRGGHSRARRLSSSERSAIALHAAAARWSEQPPSSFFSSVRLEAPKLSDPVYLEEILSEGAWKDWQRLYKVIANQPFGEVAEALKKVCSSVKIYGATNLWRGILRWVQGDLLYEETEAVQNSKESSNYRRETSN